MKTVIVIGVAAAAGAALVVVGMQFEATRKLMKLPAVA